MSDEHEVIDPILVSIYKPEPERTVSADVASYRTITIAATDTQPIKILSQDRMRHKAQIIVHNPIGAAPPAVPAFCYMGQQAQVAANGDARGAVLVAGDNFPYEAASAAYLITAGVAVSVTVIEERDVTD